MLTFQPVSAHPAGNCHLLCAGEDAVLIDASLSFCGEQTALQVARALGNRRLRAILLSHSHYDHTTGLWWLHRAFPDVPESQTALLCGLYPDYRRSPSFPRRRDP